MTDAPIAAYVLRRAVAIDMPAANDVAALVISRTSEPGCGTAVSLAVRRVLRSQAIGPVVLDLYE
jgi:hypothetical protein